MNWSAIARHLSLDADQERRGRELLHDFRGAFEAVCRRPWPDSDDSPFETLARHLATRDDDRVAASSYLRGLLERDDASASPTRLAEILRHASETRAGLEHVLLPAQREEWRVIAPANLLDLDIDGDELATALSQRVTTLRRPEGFLCTSPFEYAHIQANGDVYPCCPSKFAQVIGNLREAPLETIWRSRDAQAVRESMLDGSHRFCNADACEYLRDAITRAKSLAPPPLVDWARAAGMLDARVAPRTINCAFDRSCNLSCSYCREKAFRPTPADRRSIAQIDESLFASLLEGTERIILLGEGDPFASPFYRERLTSYDWSRHPRLRIKIQTNGLLLTRDMWAHIARSHQAIDWISVSVDAATPATYRRNRGGDFAMLRRNLTFIAELFATGAIRRFHLNFIVQANNFHEVPAFARLGRELGCDLIEFQRIENWGVYTDEEFQARAVHLPAHPQHRAFRRVLTHPDLDNPAVWLLKLGDCVPDAGSVDIVAYDACQ